MLKGMKQLVSHMMKDNTAKIYENYYSIFDHIPDLVVLFDKKGIIVGFNQAVEKIMKVNKEMILHKHFNEFLLAEEKIRIDHYFELALSGEPQTFTCSSLCPSETRYIFSCSCFPLRHKNKIVGTYVICKDITEYTKIEQAFRESESKYKIIAEHTSDLIGVFSIEGKMLYASPSHLPVLGISEEEIMLDSISRVHLDDRQVLFEKFTETVSTKKLFEGEFRWKHKEGHWVHLEAKSTPILDEKDQVTAVVVVSRDVSERKKAEELLWSSEKLSIIGELAAGVAHEIRNPLTTIKGFIQLLSMEKQDWKYQELLMNELSRIEMITSEFLLLAKPQEPQFLQKDIQDILKNVCILLQPQANLLGCDFTLSTEFERQYIQCEENHIKQVFINVIKNAMESMPAGGSVQISVTSCDTFVTVKIKDEGIGVASEIIEKLGQPFFSLKHKGTGLGLMVCNRIIKQHRGDLQFFSKVGEGTTVQIVLPK